MIWIHACIVLTARNSMCQHYQFLELAYLMLPLKCLKEPSDELLLRDRNPNIVASLKQEIMNNPYSDVQPILCIAQLKDGECFDTNLKEAYSYYTIDGNHSRQALQELLKEKPHLTLNRQYTHRLCAIYKPMVSKLARRLASKHNRAAVFNHEMTTWDLVSIYRDYIYFKLLPLYCCIAGYFRGV